MSSRKKVVLVAVLDWGLGHASRSIPLIGELRLQGVKVIMAGSGRAGELLKKSYPDLTYVECPAYAVHYKGKHLYWSMLRQLPKICRAVLLEYRWLKQIIRAYNIGGVISDSRFGCFNAGIPSVILTHQLHLPLRPKLLSVVVNRIYRYWLKSFDAVWVPDLPNGLSGTLSYPSPFAGTTRYIGWLSRFNRRQGPIGRDLLVLLSGPEPQRSYLEAIVISQLTDIGHIKVTVVQGKTDVESRYKVGKSIEVVSYLAGAELENVLVSSATVLCRSGYSSLMDLAKIGKRAILVPTPGQPEQEYLAKRCRQKGWAVVAEQNELDLIQLLERAGPRSGPAFPEEPVPEGSALPKVISDFLKQVSADPEYS